MIELRPQPVIPHPLLATSPPRIALVGGQWAQNVGNAFFNLGGHYVLRRVFGPDAVGFHQDQPNYRTLHNKFKGNPPTYADLIQDLEIDWLVLQGPVLNAWMAASWQQTFATLKARGVRIMLHSAAFFKFSEVELVAVKTFLQAYPPDLISTRDPRSHGLLSDWLPDVPCYSGIDAGFFLPQAVSPFKFRTPPHLVMNFDRYPEPSVAETPFDSSRFRTRQITHDGVEWHLGIPKRLDRLAHRGKIKAYLGDLTDRRHLPKTINGLRVIRPEHRFFPHMTHKIYRQPGAFASDEPWSYLSTYANSDLTLSDRVHACVATLAYGNRAMLFTPSPRAALFESLGLEDIRNQVMQLDLDRLSEAQETQISWLQSHV